jgi:hypothetical protein
MMQYQIKFISGENQGNSYPLLPEQVVSIGRSHSNAIRLSAPDVSGKHVIIRTDKGGNMSIEVLSSRTTVINGAAASIGDMLSLPAGSSVQMGNNTVFVVEPEGGIGGEDDGAKTRLPADDEKTSLPGAGWNVSADAEKTTIRSNQETTSAGKISSILKTAGRTLVGSAFSGAGKQESFSSEETLAFQTRVASDDEMEKIKSSFRTRQRKRIILIALPLLVFFGVAVFLYFFMKPAPEEIVTWPRDSKDNQLIAKKNLAPYLIVYYPDVPENSVTEGDSGFEINTRVGQQHDVRLHILAKTVKDPATLEQNHEEAFENWKRAMQDKEATLSFGEDRKTLFLNTKAGAGVPMTYVSYTRRVENDDFWGYAFFLRKENTIHSILIEVELGDQWRVEDFMHKKAREMIVHTLGKSTEMHWEGTSFYRRNTPVETDLKEAAGLMEREAPVYWGQIHYLLISALIKSAKAGNPNREQVAEAQNMLIRLRQMQTVWYNTQRLAWQEASINEYKNTMNSIQSMAESVFSSEFQYSDFRYDLIKRKAWK